MNNEIKVTLNNENVILVKAQRGVEGARGADGAEGPKGDGLEVLSIYPTLLDLETAHPTGNKGDCYAVGTSSSNEVYFWDIDNSEWSNLGSIMGPPGVDGTNGADGADGANGINGTDGADGKSAYQSALDGGFIGTELEFNEALAEVKNKQSTLVSGTNIKTINGNSVLGSGDLVIPTGLTYTVYTATIPSASWTGSSAPYSKVVTVTGILSTDVQPSVNTVMTGTYATDIAMQENLAKIYRIVNTDNTLTCYANSIPTADIPIQIVVVR